MALIDIALYANCSAEKNQRAAAFPAMCASQIAISAASMGTLRSAAFYFAIRARIIRCNSF